jgi:hypothetical protein
MVPLLLAPGPTPVVTHDAIQPPAMATT